MTHTIITPSSSLPAWERRLDQHNKASGTEPIAIEALLQLLHDEETDRLVSLLKNFQREALIPVADQILAASPEKQVAAIAAARKALQ
jgi:hypothetical protein